MSGKEMMPLADDAESAPSDSDDTMHQIKGRRLFYSSAAVAATLMLGGTLVIAGKSAKNDPEETFHAMMRMDVSDVVEKNLFPKFREAFKQKDIDELIRDAKPSAIEKGHKVRTYHICRSMFAGKHPSAAKAQATTILCSCAVVEAKSTDHIVENFKAQRKCLNLPTDEFQKCYTGICPWMFKS